MQSLIGEDAPLSSVGWTVPNAVSKIIDPETGAEIGVPRTGLSAPGELWFKGPNVMAGYLGNAEATAETIDAEGFLHTGDLARVDYHGCVYIVDRLKELIKYKGYQVPPAELEALLLTHPGGRRRRGGRRDRRRVRRGGAEGVRGAPTRQCRSHADEVMAFVAEQVAPYKKVRQVEFIDAVPKSASGKILRKDLRGRASPRRGRAVGRCGGPTVATARRGSHRRRSAIAVAPSRSVRAPAWHW